MKRFTVVVTATYEVTCKNESDMPEFSAQLMASGSTEQAGIVSPTLKIAGCNVKCKETKLVSCNEET